MFTLAIVFSILFNGQVGFLTNDFCWGRLMCQDGTTTYMAEADTKKTFHNFTLPEGDFKCKIIGFGDGYIHPSVYDFVSKDL